MSQLELMMAEENKNANSYDGRDGDGAFLVALPHPWLVSQVKTQCRIEIRRQLGFRLHEGIEQLELPTSLKRYLMFCELFSFVRQSCLKEELLKIFFKYIDQL